MFARCGAIRTVLLVPAISDQLVDSGGESLQRLGVSCGFVITGQPTECQGQHVGVLAAAAPSITGFAAVSIGQLDDPAFVRVKVLSESPPLPVRSGQVRLVSGCVPGHHHHLQRPADTAKVVGVTCGGATGHGVAGHHGHFARPTFTGQQEVVEGTAYPVVAQIDQAQLVGPCHLQGRDVVVLFAIVTAVIAAGVSDRMSPDRTGLDLPASTVLPDRLVHFVCDVDINQMPGSDLGAVEKAAITGPQVLLEKTPRGVVLEIAPGIPLDRVPVAVVE